MTNQIADSGQKVPGGDNANVSAGTGGVQPNSTVSGIDINQFVETLVKHPGFQAVLQSTKDRRFSKLEGQMNDLQKSLYEKLQAEGMNSDKAAEIAVAQNFAQPAAPQSTVQAAPAADVVKTVLEDTGLSSDDPDVIAVRQKNMTPQQLEAELYRIAYRRTKPSSPAAIVQPPGRNALQEDATILTAELEKLNKSPNPGNKARRQELMDKIIRLTTR